MNVKLKNNKNEEVKDVDTFIKKVLYIGYKSVNAGQTTYFSIATSVPTGYSLVCYEIDGTCWVSELQITKINSTDTECAVSIHNWSSSSKTATIYIYGIYAKNVI